MAFTCPICSSKNCKLLLNLTHVPLQDGRLWATATEARNSPTGTIDMVLCADCSHAWNNSFELSRLTFDADYDISLWHSPVYADFVDRVIARLIERYDLRHKKVFELGCGKGEFLKSICQSGQNRGIGFDPTYRSVSPNPESIQIHSELIGLEKAATIQADFSVTRSVLQYSSSPIQFVKLLTSALRRDAGAVYLEVPNGESTFGERIVWNMCYEHANLYSPYSMTRLLERAGLTQIIVEACFQGQNLGGEAVWEGGRQGGAKLTSDRFGSDLSNYVQNCREFAQTFEKTLSDWRAKLLTWKSQGLRVALWGAGARAVGFCTLLNIQADVLPLTVVDINPQRQNRYLPVTAQRVLAPKELRSIQPDLVIATNPTFAPEIRKQFDQLSLSGKFEVL